MQFDSTRAWRDATAAISANRDVLLALAGVFFMLPWLAFALLVPRAEINPNLPAAQMQAALGQFMNNVAGPMLALVLVETCGVLAILSLCADRSRPTVGQAIGRGAIGLVTYVGAMMLLVLALMLAVTVGAAVLGRAGSAGQSALLIGVIGLMFYGQVRMIMVAPAIAVERRNRPWQVVKRSWQLTRGNVSRILFFLALLVIAGQIGMGVVGMLVESIGTLAAGKETGHIAESIVSAGMLGLFQLLMTGVMGAIHNQLAEPAADTFA